jgi:PAS domain S-box-containing protein
MAVVSERLSMPEVVRGSIATSPVIAALVDESSEALIALAPDGRVLFWSRGAAEMFGYHAREAVGYTLDWLIGTEGHRTTEVLTSLSRGGSVSFETERRRKDRSRLHTAVTMRRVDDHDPPFIVTRHRQIVTGESLRELDWHAREATRLKGEFLANVSHELRTPLNAIIGFAELMHKGKVGLLSGEHAEFVSDILTSARHLLHLVNDIVDLSKLEVGKSAFQPQTVDVARVVDEVHDIVRGLLAKKHLRFEATIDPSLVEVVTDPLRLKQVVYAYVSNAIKFGRERGRVAVRVCAAPDGMLRIEVEDDGVGIAECDQPRLFIEFQQLDPDPDKVPGKGLGLALAKHIVEAQGGQVGVRTALDRGSTFFATLPLLPRTVTHGG